MSRCGLQVASSCLSGVQGPQATSQSNARLSLLHGCERDGSHDLSMRTYSRSDSAETQISFVLSGFMSV